MVCFRWAWCPPPSALWRASGRGEGQPNTPKGGPRHRGSSHLHRPEARVCRSPEAVTEHRWCCYTLSPPLSPATRLSFPVFWGGSRMLFVSPCCVVDLRCLVRTYRQGHSARCGDWCRESEAVTGVAVGLLHVFSDVRIAAVVCRSRGQRPLRWRGLVLAEAPVVSEQQPVPGVASQGRQRQPLCTRCVSRPSRLCGVLYRSTTGPQ